MKPTRLINTLIIAVAIFFFFVLPFGIVLITLMDTFTRSMP